MTINTAMTTPPGTYQITITGTEVVKGEKLEHNTQVVLKVIIPESISVTTPNGGEEWCAGSSRGITWTSTGIDTVQIEYSTDGGSSWIMEADKVPAPPGSYSWTVPDAPSANCLVRICDAQDGTPCDQSDAVFTILALPAAPSDCVASDSLCDKVNFCWQDNSDNEVGFYIYRGDSKLDSVGADVTCYDDFTATPGVTYEYCVSAHNNCGESSQCCDDGTIGVETIEVIAPNGGEEWCAGNIHDVTWTSTCTDTVKIDYSTDGGSSWITEADKVPAAPGSYSWTIPDAPSTNCLVKICDAEDGTPCDQSDTVFTICVEDFTIEVTPGARKVLAGNSISYSVVLTSLYGFASSCSLAVTGLPADASGSFDPTSIVPTDTSLLTVNTSETTPPGFYDLTVTAAEVGGGGIEHSTQVVLMVAVAEAVVGDANGNGTVESRDVVYLINYLFRNDLAPDPLEAGDTNCDGVINPGDVIYLLNYLFRNGPPPDC
jgi:hypothetical protein